MYMLTSFFLLGIVAFLYYNDAKKSGEIYIREQMLQALSALRENPDSTFDTIDVNLEEAEGKHAPHFWKLQTKYELVACANPAQQGKVFVLTTPLSSVEKLNDEILKKILVAFALLIFPFFAVGYFLARFSIKPLRKTYGELLCFNADIIHDLKTPINTISLNSGMLEDKNLKVLQRISYASSTLQGLYKNLDSYLRDKEMFNKERLDVKMLIQEHADKLKLLYPKATVTVNVKTFYVHSDHVAFDRIIDNLLTNAMKHGAKEAVVEISIEKNILKISDNGKGIVNPDSIFARNYRENIYVAGFGLGLNIVKSLCEALDIVVSIELNFPVGTSITLDLSTIAELT